jgi:hypothetical protein
MTADPIILKYYSDLLVVQYKGKPKAVATVQAAVKCSICDGLLQQLATSFDLDTATGDQLTLIGKIVGVPREVIGFDLSHTFFQMVGYSEDPTGRIGMGSYSDDPYTESLFKRYIDNASYSLSDFEMLSLIKMKIICNNSGSSFKDIKEALYTYFQGGIDILPSTAMNLTFTYVPEYETTVLAADFLRILPNPMGVGYTLEAS